MEGRTELLNDLGRIMEREGWASLEDLYQQAEKRIATGSPNLLELLARFRAYNDPVRKKSFFPLGLMRNSAGWEYADAQELGPPVDYHEVRGHLRLGTVTVNDPALREKLLHRLPVDEAEDVAIRSAVARAVRLIGEKSGVSDAMRLHYLFWNLFRSVCQRDHPHCRSYPADGPLPPRYAHLVVQEDPPARCPFCSVCPSADAPVRYLEHVFSTDWY